MQKRQMVALVLYGLALSSVMALLAFAFIMAEQVGSHLVWDILLPLFPSRFVFSLVMLTLATALLYLMKKEWGEIPRTSHEILEELKEHETLTAKNSWRDLLAALVILSFGAGVGPEAPLLGAVIVFSIWQADKLRFITFHWQTVVSASFAQKISYLFHPRKYRLAYPHVKARGLLNPKRKLWISLFILNGLVSFLLLMRATDQPSFVTKLGVSHWQLADLVLVLPLMVYGLFSARAYGFLKRLLERGMRTIQKRPHGQLIVLIIGALAILMMANTFPTLLFSGQHSMHLLHDVGMEIPSLLLLGLSLLKLLFLEVCILSGWTGGDIFPITFASVLHGFAIAQLFPGYDSLLIVLAVSLSFAIGLLGNEWLAGLFLSLFFPSNLWLLSFLMVVLCSLLKKWKERTRKESVINETF